VQSCSNCGRDNPDDSSFCANCGSVLTGATAPAREERKVVTVLFADLVGFTSRSERLDPEDVRATLSPYFARLREELERRGGTVEKFIGDAVMAVFGAPAAHEDDPERAVRAALAIREALAEMNEQDPELDLHLRVGINTGEALVSLGASPLSGEGMAAGDVVNTAARLQTAAPVDGIAVGVATYRATERAIEYRERDAVEAKGKTEPVTAWEAIAPRSSFGIDVTRRVDTRLVGRERELALLRDALDRVRHQDAARDAGRRAGDRQEPARARALRAHRRDAGADQLAAGEVPAVRGGGELLGPRRDGEGRGGHPRDGPGRGRGREAR
jgi:class 3 adenylate cyclase